MKIHSLVDLITNSSSTVYIYPPDREKLDLAAKKLGLRSIDVSLSKKWLFKNDDVVKSYFEENDLDFNDYLQDKDKYYDDLNQAFLYGYFTIYKWVSEEDAVYKDYIEDELEIVLNCNDGDTKNLSNIIDLIRSCFERD
jgi:hypothetical protein